jgi:hypothetical protein
MELMTQERSRASLAVVVVVCDLLEISYCISAAGFSLYKQKVIFIALLIL